MPRKITSKKNSALSTWESWERDEQKKIELAKKRRFEKFEKAHTGVVAPYLPYRERENLKDNLHHELRRLGDTASAEELAMLTLHYWYAHFCRSFAQWTRVREHPAFQTYVRYNLAHGELPGILHWHPQREEALTLLVGRFGTERHPGLPYQGLSFGQHRTHLPPWEQPTQGVRRGPTFRLALPTSFKLYHSVSSTTTD
jgi:hypothetical protein